MVRHPTHSTVLLFVEGGRSVSGGIEGMHTPQGTWIASIAPYTMLSTISWTHTTEILSVVYDGNYIMIQDSAFRLPSAGYVQVCVTLVR